MAVVKYSKRPGCAPSVRSTGNHAFCDRMVPKPPGEAPSNATGRPPNSEGIPLAGRDSQSMAFLNTPGMPLLYSGVNSSTPSLAMTCTDWPAFSFTKKAPLFPSLSVLAATPLRMRNLLGA